MFTDIEFLQNDPRIDWGSRQQLSNKSRLLNINNNIIELDAQLIIPSIPFLKPSIKINRKFILGLPHVDTLGYLCLRDLPKGLDLKGQINFMLESFFEDYIPKILSNNFDEEFYKEAKNYWDVFVRLSQTQVKKYLPKLICLNRFNSNGPIVNEYYSDYIPTKKIICSTSKTSKYSTQTIKFLSKDSTIKKIRTLEIKLNNCYKPSQFSHNKQNLHNLLKPFLTQDLINNYLQTRKDPSLIILRSETCDYAYLINFTIQDKGYYADNKKIPIIPIYCDKADIEWIYGRYKKTNIQQKQSSRIICFGAGILGCQVLPLLIREGIGEITLIDYDYFDTPNLSRHSLGIDSLYKNKVDEIEKSLQKLPSCIIKAIPTSAEQWLSKNSLDNFDLILDLTGNKNVRQLINYYRKNSSLPFIIGWMEPYVSAGHVVICGKYNDWEENLWDTAHAFDSWPPAYLTNEPGCASRFQSYSGIEANKVISLIAEKTVCAIHNSPSQIEIYSFIQNENYCQQQEYMGNRRKWAEIDNKYESIFIKRVF